MRTLIFAATALGIAVPAYAQTSWNTTRFGNQTFSNGTGDLQGWRGDSMTLGNQTYSHTYGPEGQQPTCTTLRTGPLQTTNCQ